MKKETAFSGLEAAIVLIAFVVVAAVFSYVMLGAGFFATQKSQEVTYSGIKQATSNMVLDGQIYGASTTTSTLTFWLAIPEGGIAQKLDDVEYLYTLNNGGVSVLTTVDDVDSISLLQPGDKAKMEATINPAGPGDSFTLEIKPKIGASSLVSKTLSSGYNGGVII